MSAHPNISVPDFDSVWAKVRKSAQGVSSDTAWMRSWNPKSRRMMIPVFIGLLLVVVALLAFFTGHGIFGMLALVVAFVLAAPPIVKIMREVDAASNEHSHTVVAPMIQELMKHMSAHTSSGTAAQLQASYEPEGAMPVAVLSRSGFIRDAQALQEDFIRGSFGQTEFMLTDVKWQTSKIELSPEAKARQERKQQREHDRRQRQRDRELREKYGRNWRLYRDRQQSSSSLLDLVPDSVKTSIKDKYDAFERSTQKMGPSMVVFAADFHKAFASKTYLLPREREDQAIRNFSEESAAQGGMEPLTLEDPGISQRFVGWTSDQVEARYLLTPELMLAISDAAERMESDRIAVSFRDSWMYFAVVLDEDRFSLSMQPDEDQGYQIARSIYDDLVAFLSLIEHFNLNTRIWSKV